MEASPKPCPFCTLPPERIVHSNAHAVAIRDGYPISPGHTLIIPKRHIGSFFETTPAERTALLELLDQAKADLDTNPPPAELFTHIAEPTHQYNQIRTETPALYRVTNWQDPANRKPHAFNIGINDGPAAGQTVPHLHIHLIPRYEGDQQDPRGGVRWIIPDKARYWP